MVKRYDVVITETNEGWGYSDIKRLYCPEMSVRQIQKYLRGLENVGKIPGDSCVYCINAQFVHSDSEAISLSRNQLRQPQLSERASGELQITIQRTNGKKCHSQNCFANIQNGKCIDKFMIDVIGKKFFAEKYKNTQTQK